MLPAGRPRGTGSGPQNAPDGKVPGMMTFLLRIAALVLFIVAALALWVANMSIADALGLVAVGLACWVASTLPMPPTA
jgi:hypothetical protein